MIDDRTLENTYQESLDESIIAYLSEVQNTTLDRAMDLFYSSKLADKIHTGTYGIQYLDYKTLVSLLIDTEPELFR